MTPKSYSPGPEITVSNEELNLWSKPYKYTLIVIVFADDFYLVRLTLVEDYMVALFEGPWKVDDHYLIIQR